MDSEAAVPWSIVMTALVVRLVGVFLVLTALGLGIQLCGAITARLQRWQDRRSAES